MRRKIRKNRKKIRKNTQNEYKYVNIRENVRNADKRRKKSIKCKKNIYNSRKNRGDLESRARSAQKNIEVYNGSG